MKTPKPTPTTEQLNAVLDFADKYGRNWKDVLTVMWLRGTDDREPNGHLLRQVRNRLGPRWLSTFQP